MPPYQHITNYIEQNFNPTLPWCNQAPLIHEIAWMITDYIDDLIINRALFEQAIMHGIYNAAQNYNINLQPTRISQLKENLIRDIESFKTTPDYWRNIP